MPHAWEDVVGGWQGAPLVRPIEPDYEHRGYVP